MLFAMFRVRQSPSDQGDVTACEKMRNPGIIVMEFPVVAANASSSRAVLQPPKPGLSVREIIPKPPWIDSHSVANQIRSPIMIWETCDDGG
jgi:hypothetical protein